MFAICRQTHPLLTKPLAIKIKNNPKFIPDGLFSKAYSSKASDGFPEIHTSTPLKLDRNNKKHIGFKIIPQGHVAILERLGKFKQLMKPGLHFLIPIIDKISYSFPLKRISFSVTPQEAFTQDNVKVKLGGDIIVRVVDAEKAAYGASSPFSLAAIYAQAAMRNAIGELTLDEVLNQREKINKKVFETVNHQTSHYGLECLGYEIKGLQVPSHIEEEMARQVTSERKRRETVLNSEGERDAAANKAEGLKRSAQLNSEGKKIAQINEAMANAEQRRIEAEAEARALELIGEAIRRNPEAASIKLASESLETWKKMQEGNHMMIVPHGYSPVETLLASAIKTYNESNQHMITNIIKK